MVSNQLKLFTTRRFLPLFITQFFGAFNDNVFKNALIILITFRIADLLGMNAQLLVVMAAGLFILPFFLFSATAGQLADKYEKSRMISIVKLIEIIVMMTAVIGFYLQNAYFLMVVLFVLGVQATFFGPLKYAILPEHLYEEELIAGNGLIEAGTFIAILLGTILGGVLILQHHGEYVISAIIMLVALAGWGSSLFIPKSTTYQSSLQVNYNFITETKNLLVYSKHNRDVFLCILGISWFWLFGATFLSELPVFAKDALHADQGVVTLFLALFAIGLAVGSVLCNKLLNGKIHASYVPFGVLGMTIFTVDLYFAAAHAGIHASHSLIGVDQFLHSFNGWRIAIDLILIAISGGLYTVPLYAMMQYRSAPSHRARVIASNNVVNSLFMVIAAIATAVMIQSGFAVAEVLLTIAICNGLVAIYICKLLPDAIIKGIFKSILKLLYRVKVTGLENYDLAGERVVIVANHTSFLDAILLAAFLPDKLTFAIDTHTAKEWWIKQFLRLVDAYPMDPTNPMAIKSLIRHVEQNKRCVIFPEGRITMTGALMKIYEGPGMMADKSGAKILPIHIDGAQYTPFSRLRGKVGIRWMPTITMTIQPPRSLDIPAEIKGRARRERIGRELYDLMTDMVFRSADCNKTLFQSLIEAKQLHGKKHVIICDIERVNITYQAIITRSFILGSLFSKQTKTGECVGVLLPNVTSNIITFFALQAFGRVPAMLNYTTGANNVMMACKTAKINVIYTSRKFIRLANLLEMIESVRQSGIRIEYLEEVVGSISLLAKVTGFCRGLMPATAYKLIHLLQSSRHILQAEQPATVLFTSGSEGAPKGVVLTHHNLQSNRYQLSACIDFTPTDSILNALPIFHSFGLTAGTLLPLLSGVKVFLYPSPLHYRIIPQVSYDINATIMFGTDTFLAGYAKHAHPYDFYSIRYVFTGAEKLRMETRTLWAQKFGIRLFEGYGATEASPVISINTPMYNKVGTVGRFLPGIQYKLQPVPGINEGGALTICGPNIMQGYYLANNPGVLVAPKDGWYETGDIVAIDETGFITIKGRLKRFAKIAGEMVSLTMVEDLIYAVCRDAQHAVISVPDDRKGEQIVLVTTAKSLTREAVLAEAQKLQIGEICIPRKIFFVEKMFLLGTGKVDYVNVAKFVELSSRKVP